MIPMMTLEPDYLLMSNSPNLYQLFKTNQTLFLFVELFLFA